MRVTGLIACATLLIAAPVAATDETAQHSEAELRATMAAYAQTLTPDGAGPEAYASYLADDYSRWAIGGDILTRAELVSAVEDWHAAGNRVTRRESDILELSIVGDYAFVRSHFVETFENGDGPTGEFRGFVAATWRAAPGGWRLVRSDQIAAPEAE